MYRCSSSYKLYKQSIINLIMIPIKIYINSKGVLILDDMIIPNGSLVFNILSETTFNIRWIDGKMLGFDNQSKYYNIIDISDVINANDIPYTNVQDLINDISDFFVKAPFNGGYPIVESIVSGTNNITLQFCKAIIQINPLVSTDILTLTLAQTTSTKIGEYIYSFTTGATAPTITWPIECKESIVISPNKKYLISFVRVSATKVFTFIDEEGV